MKIIFFWTIIIAACTALNAKCSEPRIERYVYINGISPNVAPYNVSGQGVLHDVLAQQLQAKANKALLLRYDLMKKAAPNFDIPGVVAEATRCMPIAGEIRRCVDPIVLETEEITQPSGNRNAGDVVEVITISLDYSDNLAMKGGMIFHLTLDEATFGANAEPTHRHLQLVYWDPPPKEITGSPFEGVDIDHLSERDQASSRYWLVGTPSKFELSIRRALADFRGVAEIYYPHAQSQEKDPTTTAWWKSLPTRADLKKQGVVPCLWRECKRPYVRIDGDRLWDLPESIPVRAVFQSVPTSVWKKN